MDRAKWGWPPNSGPYGLGHVSFSQGISDLKTLFLDPARTHLYVDHSIDNTSKPIGIGNANNAGIPHAQAAGLVINITEVDVTPISGNQDEEYVKLTNPNSTAVDISGWTLTGGISFTFGQGTIIPAGGSLYVSPNTKAFRSRATGPTGGQSLFVVGPYDGHISALGETIQLKNTDGSIVSSYVIPNTASNPQTYLRITEINYHPIDPPTGSSYTQNDFEFVELYNTSGTVTIDLTGVHFSSNVADGTGIEFDFSSSGVASLAPGQYIVVAKNPTALATRYNLTGVTVVGPYSGFLSNSNDTLYLYDAVNEKINEISYADADPWPQEADGIGATLEIINPLGNDNDPDNWRSSSEYGGSPGQGGMGPIENIVVNEVLTNTDPPLLDSIELYNTTNAAVNISGWYLSDSSGDLKKYRIPEGTVIGPYGYLVLTEEQFGSYFSLSSAGEEVWLVEADASGNLTYFADHVEFPAAINGESFGRWPNGAGDLYPLVNRTFGQANDSGGNAPRIGPLLISEVMYHPNVAAGQNADDFEYIEIFNPTTAAVDLSGWQLSGGVDLVFSAGTTIGARETLLVLPFDPTYPLNDIQLANFKTMYDIGPSVKLAGGFNGHLANEGEKVQLLKADGSLEDEVHYDPVSPWPMEADGGGSSLQRLTADSWGDAAESWIAAAPAPGSAMMIASAGEWIAAGLTLKIESLDGLLHLYQTGTTTDVVPPCVPASITSVNITGRDNIDDVLTIDFSNGNPIPAGGLIFNGGNLGAGSGNSLYIIGSSGNESAVLSATQITLVGSAPITFSNTTFFSFHLGGGSDSLLVNNNATLKINQDNAISAGTNVTIDGGVLDLNGNTDTIGSLLLKSGSVINGTLHANAYNIESGTVTAAISGTGDLLKTTPGQATVGTVNTANTTVSGGELIADSIFTGTLTVGPGATVTIAPIAGGPLGTHPLFPLAENNALAPLDADAVLPNQYETVEQPTTYNTIAPSLSTTSTIITTTIAAEPITTSCVLVATASVSSEAALAPASPDSLSNTVVLNAIATPAPIVADMALPGRLVQSTPTKIADTTINRTLLQSPIYSRLDAAALHGIIEIRLESTPAEKVINSGKTPIFAALPEALPSRTGVVEKRAYTPAINGRQAPLAALQTNSRWADSDAGVDFDIAQHVRAGKHSKQLEKAVDEVLAEEDAIPVVL